MKFLGRLILNLFSNAIAILAADYFISGFSFSGNFIELLMASTILTVLHVFIAPILKFLLTPFIIITFGLLLIVINAATLYMLDILSESIKIQGYIPLLYGTLLISAISVIAGIGAKMCHKQD